MLLKVSSACSKYPQTMPCENESSPRSSSSSSSSMSRICENTSMSIIPSDDSGALVCQLGFHRSIGHRRNCRSRDLWLGLTLRGNRRKCKLTSMGPAGTSSSWSAATTGVDALGDCADDEPEAALAVGLAGDDGEEAAAPAADDDAPAAWGPEAAGDDPSVDAPVIICRV